MIEVTLNPYPITEHLAADGTGEVLHRSGHN
jgi:hypothetical protein